MIRNPKHIQTLEGLIGPMETFGPIQVLGPVEARLLDHIEKLAILGITIGFRWTSDLRHLSREERAAIALGAMTAPRVRARRNSVASFAAAA